MRFTEKGGKQREIPVRHDLDEWIDAYLEAGKIDLSQKAAPLFLAADRWGSGLVDRALTAHGVRRMLKRRLKEAGLPEVVMPSEYLPEVFGGEVSDTCEFAGLDEANDILGLMMRHWNTITAALHKEDVYLPILLEDETGVCLGNNWARGFIHGVAMRKESWAELMTDEEHAGWMIPVLSLYHEHDENPETRPGPIGPERREQIIAGMAAGIVGAYRYFRPHRQRAAGGYASEPRSDTPKIGRNDPCPCAVLARNTSVAAAA